MGGILLWSAVSSSDSMHAYAIPKNMETKTRSRNLHENGALMMPAHQVASLSARNRTSEKGFMCS